MLDHGIHGTRSNLIILNIHCSQVLGKSAERCNHKYNNNKYNNKLHLTLAPLKQRVLI